MIMIMMLMMKMKSRTQHNIQKNLATNLRIDNNNKQKTEKEET